MPPYHYSPLSNHSDSIRLLRILPAKVDEAEIRGELLEYCLQESSRSSYEALSYVWGDANTVQSIFIDDTNFHVTPNLYAALLRLRDANFPRIIWIDAICINQSDDQEKGHQIQIMANIYGKANRVVVWLGEKRDNSDEALEAIRAAGMDRFERSEIPLAITSLLQREWFERIWVLQEVAAARSILIMCGATKIDGYAFCSGLEQFKDVHSRSHAQVRAVTYLIRGAIFRSELAISSVKRASLNICSLSDLVSMYHTHQATRRHDKIYALLGMASDDIGQSGLLPDYKVPWNEILQRLIRFLLGGQVRIKTWNDKEEMEIYGNGCILGHVTQVTNLPDGGQTVDIKFSDALEDAGRYRKHGSQWTLQANQVQRNDIVYHLQGASNPSIIRVHGDRFHIVLIAAIPPTNLQSTAFPYSLPIVWDWINPPGQTPRRAPDMIEGPFNPLHGAFILKGLGEDNEAKVQLLTAIRQLSRTKEMVHITERDVSEVVRRFEQEVVALLIRRMGHRISITEGVLVDIVQYHDKELVVQVFEEQRAEIRITTAVIKAAASNINHGNEVMGFLIDWMGQDATGHISEAVIRAAAGNVRSGAGILQCLLSYEGFRIQVTDGVLVAAAGNTVNGLEIMEMLLHHRKQKDRVLDGEAAAAENSPKGLEIMKRLLSHKKQKHMFPDRVLVAAAANEGLGLAIMRLLLDHEPKRKTITEAVVAAAARNEKCGPEVLKLLCDRIPEAFSIYVSMGSS